MDANLALQLVQTIAVLAGVIFGLVQLRQMYHQREIQAGVELLRPLQTPQAAEAMMLVHALPDRADPATIEAALGDRLGAVLGTLGLFESLGPLVARGHLPIAMYAESYRGPTMICWRRMRPWIEARRAAGWPTLFEWLQWLAERMEESADPARDAPAWRRFRRWRRARDYDRLAPPA